MKHLYGMADLEAQVFEAENEAQNSDQEIEFILGDGTSEEYAELTDFIDQGAGDFPALELSLELSDGRILEYEVASVFVHGEKEYIGLHPKTDTEGLIHIMQLMQGVDDEIELLPIKDEEELRSVYDTFFKLYADEYTNEASDNGKAENDDRQEESDKIKKSRRFQVR